MHNIFIIYVFIGVDTSAYKKFNKNNTLLMRSKNKKQNTLIDLMRVLNISIRNN